MKLSWLQILLVVLVGFFVIGRFTGDEEYEEVWYGERLYRYGSSEQDRRVRRRMDAWYSLQLEQDCFGVSESHPAVSMLKRALAGDKGLYVHTGPPNPYNDAVSLSALRARPNPNGSGIIVHGWSDKSNPLKAASYRRTRYAWLVIEEGIYPLNGWAVAFFGRVFKQLPDEIQAKSGLHHKIERGLDPLAQIGLTQITFKSFPAGDGNPFPDCQGEYNTYEAPRCQ